MSVKIYFILILFALSISLETYAEDIDTDLATDDIASSVNSDLSDAIEAVADIKENAIDNNLKINQQCFDDAQLKSNFSVCGDGSIIYDNVTGLVWSRCAIGKIWNDKEQACEGDAAIYNWKESLNHLNVLNKISDKSFDDWRLPNVKELASIVNLSCAYPAIDEEFFPNTGRSDFWTSSVFEQYPGRAWYIKFDLGHDYPADKRYFKQLRPVRLGYGASSYNLKRDKKSDLENSCAAYQVLKKTMVVLIPDSDGSVGNVSVSIDSASENLTEAYTTLEVNKDDKSLATPSHISEEETNTLFASALAAKPEAEKHFFLYFNTGTTRLTSESQQELEKILAIIEPSSSIMDIYISGHTDTQGSDEINTKLALKRTETIYQLISAGLSFSQIKNIQRSSHGEGDPLVTTADDVDEPLNRRVEVTIHL